MASLMRPPYRRPATERVQIINWLLLERGVLRPLPRVLPDWDPASEILLELGIKVDAPGIISDCQLAEDAILRVAAGWESSGTGLRGISSWHDFSPDGPERSCTLEMLVPGQVLEGDLTVKVELLLAKMATRVKRLSPWIMGSRLWVEQRKVSLKGAGTRFPVDVFDFQNSLTWLPGEAGWYLDWDRADFHRPVLGSVRLLINSVHEAVKRAVTELREEDEPIRQAISFDVARTMITAALTNEDFFEDLNNFEEDSVGIAVRRHLHQLFPDWRIEALRQEYLQYPERFEAMLQERLRLFWEKV